MFSYHLRNVRPAARTRRGWRGSLPICTPGNHSSIGTCRHILYQCILHKLKEAGVLAVPVVAAPRAANFALMHAREARSIYRFLRARLREHVHPPGRCGLDYSTSTTYRAVRTRTSCYVCVYIVCTQLCQWLHAHQLVPESYPLWKPSANSTLPLAYVELSV